MKVSGQCDVGRGRLRASSFEQGGACTRTGAVFGGRCCSDDGGSVLRAGALFGAGLTIWFLVLALSAAIVGCSVQSSDGSGDPELAERLRKAEAGFRSAMLLVADLKCSEAVRELLPLIQEFEAIGNRPRAAEAAFWTGYCHEKLEERSKARAFYNLAVKQYPDTPAARQAAERLARIGAE